MTDLVHRFADVSHGVWSHWMQYQFSVCIQNEDGSVTIPAEKVERWKRQMETEYEDLTEKEQQSDIHQAQKYMTTLGVYSLELLDEYKRVLYLSE
jgi:hypothetical protein